jgi:hypothetical protein
MLPGLLDQFHDFDRRPRRALVTSFWNAGVLLPIPPCGPRATSAAQRSSWLNLQSIYDLRTAERSAETKRALREIEPRENSAVA